MGKKKFDKYRLNQISPDILEAHGLITRSLNGPKGEGQSYCCIYCTSGTGKNKSGALNFKYKGDAWVHFCQVCQNGGDNVDFFQGYWQCDFIEACTRASEMFGIPIEEVDGTPYQPQQFKRHNAPPPVVGNVSSRAKIRYQIYPMPSEKTDPAEVPLIKADIKKANEHLDEILFYGTNSQRRGIDIDVLNFFNCGFLERWVHPKLVVEGRTRSCSRRIIVPTSDNEHYLALSPDIVRQANPDNMYHKVHAGVKTRCFNDCNLQYHDVFVVEGEFDAMSLWQAARLNDNYNPNDMNQPRFLPGTFDKGQGFIACQGRRNNPVDFGVVATLSAAGWKRLIIPQLDHGMYSKCKRFIILYDNNEAGRKNAEEFSHALKERGRKVSVKFIYNYINNAARERFGENVDVNDMLRVDDKDGYRLKKLIYKIYADACSEFDAEKAELDALHNQTLDLGDNSKPDEHTLEPVDKTPPTDNVAPNQPSSADTAKHDETPAKLDKTSSIAQWEAVHGKIDPNVLPQIDNAKTLLEAIDCDNLTPEIVQAPNINPALAICKFYDFCLPLYTKFFTTLTMKKDAADTQIKLQKASGAEPTKQDKKALQWQHISTRDIKAAVEKIISNQVRKAHKQFLKTVKKNLQDEELQLQIAAKNQHLADNINQINELYKQPQSPDRDAQIVELVKASVEWKLDKQGNPVAVKNTANNIHLIFMFDPRIKGLVAYDRFQEYYTVGKPAPWHTDEDHPVGELWSDADDSQIQLLIRTDYTELADKDLIRDAIVKYSHLNSYHPVKNFYDALPEWDGIPRAETVFSKFLGVEDTAMNRTITMNWLTGMFARVYFPGCDYQICIVLQGAQRIGKSRLLRMLAGELGVNPFGISYHVSLIDSFDDSHATDAIRPAVIVELEENVANKKSDVGSIKRFLSAESDTRRFSYDKRAKRIMRHCVFATTINNKSFLRDITGNARFYTLPCTNKQFQTVEGMTVQYIRQVLAEAFLKFKQMFAGVRHNDKEKISSLLRLPLEIQIANEKNNEQFMLEDGMTSEFMSWVDMKIPPDFIWLLLTKDERSRFCRDGKITLARADVDLTMRRKRFGNPRDMQADVEKISDYLKNRDYVTEFTALHNGKDVDEFTIYGSDYRRHICPSEIINECFKSNDRRNSTARANELFNSLEAHGWHVGKRFKLDSVYKDQKKILWRDGSIPTEDENPPEPKPVKDTLFEGSVIVDPRDVPFDDYFGGVPVDPNDLPF